VFYYHVVATKTVDEKVYKALEQKKDVIEHVLSEAKKNTSTPELPIQPL